jgi:hypothetical protein
MPDLPQKVAMNRNGNPLMKLISIASVVATCALLAAPALAQEISIKAKGGKSPTASEAAHCVAYYRAEAKLRRAADAPFEETLRGMAWKNYLQTSAKGADPNALIASAEKDIAAAIAKSKDGWRTPYEQPCGMFEEVKLP